MKSGNVYFFCQRAIQRGLRFVEAVQVNVVIRQPEICERIVRIEANGLLTLRQRLFILASLKVVHGQIVDGDRIMRIRLLPQLVDLVGLVHVAEDIRVIVRLDVELFQLARSVAKIVGLLRIFSALRGVSEIC